MAKQITVKEAVEEMANLFPDGKAMCPTCGGIRPVIATAYGFRMPCEEPCKVRWTRIRGEERWVAESYSPLADNRTFDET